MRRAYLSSENHHLEIERDRTSRCCSGFKNGIPVSETRLLAFRWFQQRV